MSKGTHEYVDDPRNASVLVYVSGELVPRDEAKVSVLDSLVLSSVEATVAAMSKTKLPTRPALAVAEDQRRSGLDLPSLFVEARCAEVDVDLLPVALVVADLLATAADR